MNLLRYIKTVSILLAALFLTSLFSYGQTSLNITDAISINYNDGVTGTTEIEYTGEYAGENQYAFSTTVGAGSSQNFTIQTASVTGDPRMQILMFNPNNTGEYWAASNVVDITDGFNTVTWGPHGDPVHLKFTILLDSDDAIDIQHFFAEDSNDPIPGGAPAPNSISLSDVISFDFDDGITGTDVVTYSGSYAGENQYSYSMELEAGSTQTFTINATSVTGDPRMQILMFAPGGGQYWAASADRAIESGSNTVVWGPHGDPVHVKFTILLDSDDALTVDSFVAEDSNETSANVIPDNGIAFFFEEVDSGLATYSFTTEYAEVSGDTPQSYSISIDTDSHNYFDGTSTFEAISLKVAGVDQAIAVTDVTLTIDGVSYGGPGADSLVFDIAYGGVAFDESSSAYTHLSSAQSWGGFLLSGEQSLNVLPSGGIIFNPNSSATITFTANFHDGSVELPPEYNGETAFSAGAIDTSGDSGSGRDGEPPYRWSAFVTWFNLQSDGSQGSYVSEDTWDRLENLPATWDNEVITLAPNTQSYSAWTDPDEDDGLYFLEQTLKIEGTRGTSEILGKTVNFSGTVDSNTLDSRYEVVAFIKALDPNDNYSPIVLSETTLSAAGNFSITANLPEGDYAPQLGFVLSGRNANPADDWGSIQISNLEASYDETTPISDGNFTNGSNGYWGFTSGADFNSDGGNGSVPGQVVITNTSNLRNAEYLASNLNVYETIDSFGMSEGSTYDVTYYMNRINGDDLGLVQFAFYVADTGSWEYYPQDTTVAASSIHENANPTNGEWVQYTQSFAVPASTTHALLYVLSGANSTIAFDQLNVTQSDLYSNWASNNGLTGDNASLSADPDNDGIPNGLESFLGTNPNERSSGMSGVTKTANGLSMTHAANANVSSDITSSYQWSTDLINWNDSGTSVDGSTVTIATDVTGDTTTATATVSGTELEDVFIKVSVSTAE